MKKVLLAIVLLACGFAGGYLMHLKLAAPANGAPKQARAILYWYDPMHPAYKSDKPGVAPDCGMTLVAKYADDGMATMPAGTITIAP